MLESFLPFNWIQLTQLGCGHASTWYGFSNGDGQSGFNYQFDKRHWENIYGDGDGKGDGASCEWKYLPAEGVVDPLTTELIIAYACAFNRRNSHAE